MKQSKLQREIGKREPFASVEQEAFLNLQRTADVLMSEIAAALKPAKLSPTQYNVLRILRGAGEEGLACQQIARRMITRDPDMTRLLERLERRGLIKRSKGSEDRRVICTRLTHAGRKILGQLDARVMQAHRKQLGHLGKPRLKSLINILEAVRQNG